MKISHFYKLFISLFLVSLLASSCGDDRSSRLTYTGAVRIDETAKLNVGEQITLKFTFLSQVIDKQDIKWTSNNPDIATVDANADKTCVVTGLSVGTCTIKVEVEGTDLVSECEVNVDEEGIIKILAIGNSFSEDAVENYLYELAQASGKTVVIGNLYIGGCSLETHLKNADNNSTAYSYRKIGKDGVKTTTANYSIAKGIADENWDYISMQQASPNSGQYLTYSASLPGLYEYVESSATNRNVKLILHQTWAYQQNSTHSGFDNYDKNQKVMYDSIMSAVEKAAKLVNIDMVIPSGTAIQNGRTSLIGDNFCRDGYHLNEAYGRFTAACTWYEKIFNTNVTSNSYRPAAVSSYYAKIAKEAAHTAVMNPYTITELTNYQKPDAIELKNPIFINFNKELGLTPFQGLTSFKVGSSIANLVDSEGESTGVEIKVTKEFTGGNDQGVTSSLVSWIPNDVSKYAFYSSSSHPTSEFTISNLRKENVYYFTFFGSRKDVTDNRETAYRIIGDSEATVYLNASSNASNTTLVKGVKPNADGKIVIEISAGPNNENGSKFYYVNAMKISATDQ